MSTGTWIMEMLRGPVGCPACVVATDARTAEARETVRGPHCRWALPSTSALTDTGLKGAKGFFLSQGSCDLSLGWPGLL